MSAFAIPGRADVVQVQSAIRLEDLSMAAGVNHPKRPRKVAPTIHIHLIGRYIGA